MQLRLYIGLPGSGKTYLARQEHARLGGIMLDDKFSLEELEAAIIKVPDHIFITDPNLCLPATRNKMLSLLGQMGVDSKDITYYWFENDVEQCIRNIERRRDGRIVSAYGMHGYYAKVYTVPPDVKPLPVWKPND